MLTKSHNISWAKPHFFGKEKEYVLEALESTWISGGPYVEQFEARFINHLGSPFGITTSNGTTALELAIQVIDLKPGDEVIVPGFTFVAPVNMVIGQGGIPVYADVDSKTWCIDPNSIKEKITERTKAIIPVHIYGNVCNMETINAIAQEHNLYVIEDVAEACLSRYEQKYAGTLGHIGCFSFQATKTITMGEGGFVTTGDSALQKRMRLIRDHGMRKDKRYWHDAIGYNFRLTNLQAAVGCAQLDHINEIISGRKKLFSYYCDYLGKEEGIIFQHFEENVNPVVWAVAIKIDPSVFKYDRDGLMNFLKEVGIETRPGFYTSHSMPLYDAPHLKISQECADHIISLPFYLTLTKEDIIYVCDQFKKLRK